MASKSLIFLCLILIVFYSDASIIKTFQRQRRSTNVCTTAESWNRLTNNDPGKRCIFPFEYKGVTYNGCTDVDSEKVSRTKFFWCATEVNEDGKILEDSRNWGECNLHCTKPVPKLLGPWENQRWCQGYSRMGPYGTHCGPGLQTQKRTCTDGTIEKCRADDRYRTVACSVAGTALGKCPPSSLMVSSTGAAREAQSECLGTYKLSGKLYNHRALYKHTNNERYLQFVHCQKGNGYIGDCWMITSRIFDRHGAGDMYIYNTKGETKGEDSGRTPNEADQSRWMVNLKGQPDDVKRRYTHAGRASWYKDPTIKIVAIN